ncbi:gastric inhibitory polypeptide [Pelmatolapia mariae]|uniref:gastric inhibitory polypeptide n=1 Tax=Pelmatolapia mariae TaxID=158779 RepID=UPI002FE5B65B
MKALLFKLLIICLLGALHAKPEEMAEDEQNLRKRYAESTIASEFSKIMDSMVQKNFIKFLLSQRQKKTKPADAGKALEEHQYNDLLKLSLQEKQGRNI